jgi:nicotinamide mononucleotide transporter
MEGFLLNNYIEIFGAVSGIIYVILEIRQNIWLWPLGIATSAVYIWVFFTSKFYADMSLQGYYLVISVLGWYWWIKGSGRRAQGSGPRVKGEEQRAEGKGQGVQSAGLRPQGEGQNADDEGQADADAKLPSPEELGVGLRDVSSESEPLSQQLKVSRINVKITLILSVVFVVLMTVMYLVLDRLTDSPVPFWDSFITTLSIIATWMLARKIFEHWYLWIVVNAASVLLFYTRGLYPTVMLYVIYCAMSFVGLNAWKRSL